MSEPINHNEAWSLACHKREESNLARCYIELRELVKAAFDAPLAKIDTNRLRAIVTAND